MSGSTIANRYELGDRLGSGGMSTVYRAQDRVLERTVAVKVLAEHLSDDEKFVARFRREALAVAKASGAVDPRVLYETLAKSSADSFALRNHGMKSLLPEHHPKQAFPVSYMLKDVRYAMALANAAGLDLQGAGTAIRLLEETAQLGYKEAYYTAVLEAVRNHRWGQTPLDG